MTIWSCCCKTQGSEMDLPHDIPNTTSEVPENPVTYRKKNQEFYNPVIEEVTIDTPPSANKSAANDTRTASMPIRESPAEKMNPDSAFHMCKIAEIEVTSTTSSTEVAAATAVSSSDAAGHNKY